MSHDVVGLWPIGQCPSPLKPITRSQGGQAGTVNHPSAGSITPSKYENLISFPCLPHPHSHVFHILIPMSSTSSFPCLPHLHSHVLVLISFQRRSDRDELVFLLKREAAKKARKVRAEGGCLPSWRSRRVHS